MGILKNGGPKMGMLKSGEGGSRMAVLERGGIKRAGHGAHGLTGRLLPDPEGCRRPGSDPSPLRHLEAHLQVLR